jgi:hypothetical protein
MSCSFAPCRVPEFNWHPLLMTVSLVYLYGTGILTYRLLRHEKKKTLKLIHAIGTRSSILNVNYSRSKENLQKSGKQMCSHFYLILFKKFRTLIKTLQYSAATCKSSKFLQILHKR